MACASSRTRARISAAESSVGPSRYSTPSLRKPHLRHACRPFTPPAELVRDPMPHHPGDPIAGNEQRYPPALFPRNLRVHKEVLQLLPTAKPERPKAISRAP